LIAAKSAKMITIETKISTTRIKWLLILLLVLAGFIGSNLAQKLLEQGDQVIGIDQI
jgi:hypothetical protein